MAKTEVKTITRKRIVLTLTQREAEILFLVSGAIGGDPQGPREVMDAIYVGLASTLDAADPSMLTGRLGQTIKHSGAIYLDKK